MGREGCGGRGEEGEVRRQVRGEEGGENPTSLEGSDQGGGEQVGPL